MHMLTIPENVKKDLENKHYGLVGSHSAVQICEWTKKSLRGKGECYKNKFYGASTHSCAQVSPNVMWCDQNCIFCWRPAEYMLKKEIKEKVENTKDIIEGLVKARYKLLTGFKGQENIDKKKLHEALDIFPMHWAISLSGEPTLYPKLAEFIKELKKRKVQTIFLVSNGQNPNVIKELEKKKALPTQLYISLDAWSEKSHAKINKGIRKDSFSRLLKSLKLLKDLPTRTVIRLTVIQNVNTSKTAIKEFAKIIEMSQADFIEIKSYMWLGNSRERLKQDNMPSNDQLTTFAKALEKHLPSYKYEDDSYTSRIILYMNNGKNRKKKAPKRFIVKL